MARPCTVCRHPRRAEFERRLAEGETNRSVSLEAGCSAMAVGRHLADHLPPRLVAAAERRGIRVDDDILDQIRGGQEAAVRALDAAESSGDYGTMLQAVGHVRANVETMGKLLGRLRPDGQVNVAFVFASPDWRAVEDAILGELEALPGGVEALHRAMRSFARPGGRAA